MAFSENTPAASSTPLGVKFVRPELTAMLPTYDLIDDCIEGSEAVKNKGIEYLPMPDPSNTSEKNTARYTAYKTRSVFYNVAKRTVEGLLGQIFSRAPVIEVPTALDSVVTDTNGSGIGAEQLAKDACKLNCGKGRLGLFIDYPPRTAPATKAELASGNIRPTIAIYGPKAITNWRYKTVGSNSVPCLVVLKEDYTLQDDGFETKTAPQYRELRLDDTGKYFVQLWRASSPTADDFVRFDPPVYPTDGTGKTLDFIPFTFIGARNNEPSIDPAPMLDLCNINIGHYRNSADYEESVFLIGQPTLVIIGLDANWYNEILKKDIPFGSRSGLPLPKDADAKLVQAEPNTMAFEAMEHKERQMVALGAKLVQDKQVQRTLGEASMENAAEEATLINIAKNVSVAFQWALECCALFANVPPTGIKFELNTDFEMAHMTPEEVNATIKSWQDGGISWTEMRTILRKSGRATLEDDEAKAEIQKDADKAIADAAREIGAQTKAIADNTPPEPAKVKLADAKLLFDISIRLQIFVEGVKIDQAQDFDNVLADVEDEFRKLLNRIEYKTLDALSKRELNILIVKLRQTQSKLYSLHLDKVLSQLEEFMLVALNVNRVVYAYASKQLELEENEDDAEIPTNDEAGEALGAGLFGAAAIAIGSRALWPKIINAPIPATGALLKPYLLAWAAAAQVKVENALRKGYANGMTPQQTIVEAVKAMNSSRAQGIAASNTAMQHVASMVSAGITSGLFGKYQWLSVIDSQTTDICLSRNLKIYVYGEGPIPPAHTGCRSSIMPIGKGAGAPPETFGAWIKRQTGSIKKFALNGGTYGPKRMTLDDFGDSASRIVGKD